MHQLFSKNMVYAYMREYFGREKVPKFWQNYMFELKWKCNICFGRPFICLLIVRMAGWICNSFWP
jgi:hypothetical protein